MKNTTQIRSLNSLPESELLRLARERNRSAFDQLVQSNYPRMVRTAMRVVRNSDDAEDVAQQTFMQAWQNIDKFRGDSAFSTWLTRIALNESLTVLRHRKRQMEELNERTADSQSSEGPAFSSPGENPEDRFLREETAGLLRRGLLEVKQVYREAMRLRLVEDMSLEEISDRLGMPVNTVKVHLFRGRKAMKSFLEERMVCAAA
jgi:RNA polymerase sigma-70 factor (ECF subfamily)